MKSTSNRAGGITITLSPSESLDDVPKTHQALITDAIREAFVDPAGYFVELGVQSKLPGFQAFISELVRLAKPSLLLATGDEMFGGPTVGFQWWAGSQDGMPHHIILEPGKRESLQVIPPGLRELYSVVRWVHWDQVGFSGGLFTDEQICTVARCDIPCRSNVFPPKSTFIFGNTASGDMFINNAQGEAGFLSHETGSAYSLGSLTDALNWIFDELRQGREPEFDYERGR